MIVSEKPPLALKKRLLSPQQRNFPHFIVGETGENQACEFLRSHKYQILDRNVRLGTYEIDIIAFDTQQQEIVFVEVKTRSYATFGNPAAAVNFRKLRALRQAAGLYLQACQLENCFRFDIITVLPTKIAHFENVTW